MLVLNNLPWNSVLWGLLHQHSNIKKDDRKESQEQTQDSKHQQTAKYIVMHQMPY